MTRKGAIEARRGMWAMIPGSMGTRSYIVTGLDNPMAFSSAPTAPGRRLSRTAARKAIHDERPGRRDARHRVSGARRCCSTRFPSAYKDIDEVMAHAKELVEIRYVLKQFVNVKGD